MRTTIIADIKPSAKNNSFNQMKDISISCLINGNPEFMTELVSAILREDEFKRKDTFFNIVNYVFTELLKLNYDKSVEHSHLFLHFLKNKNFEKFIPDMSQYVSKIHIMNYLGNQIAMKNYDLTKQFMTVLLGAGPYDILEYNNIASNKNLHNINFLIEAFDGWDSPKALNILLDISDKDNHNYIQALEKKALKLPISQYENFVDNLTYKTNYSKSVQMMDSIFNIDYLNNKILQAYINFYDSTESSNNAIKTGEGSFLNYIKQRDNMLNIYKKEPEFFIKIFNKTPKLFEENLINVNDFLGVVCDIKSISMSKSYINFISEEIGLYIKLFNKLLVNNKIQNLNFSENDEVLTFFANIFTFKDSEKGKLEEVYPDIFRLPINLNKEFLYEGEKTTLHKLLIKNKNIAYLCYTLSEEIDGFDDEELKKIFESNAFTKHSKYSYSKYTSDSSFYNKYYEVITKNLTDEEIFKKLFIQNPTDFYSLSYNLNNRCINIFKEQHEFTLNLEEYHPYVEFIKLNRKNNSFDNDFVKLMEFLDKQLIVNPIFIKEKSGFVNIFSDLKDYMTSLAKSGKFDEISIQTSMSLINEVMKTKQESLTPVVPQNKKSNIFGKLFNFNKKPFNQNDDYFLNVKITEPKSLYKNSRTNEIIILFDDETNVNENQMMNNIIPVKKFPQMLENFKDLYEEAYVSLAKLNTLFFENSNLDINLSVKIRAETLLLRNLQFLNQIKDNQEVLNLQDILFLKSNTNTYLFKSLESYILALKSLSKNENVDTLESAHQEANKQISLLENEMHLVHEHIKSQINVDILDNMILQTQILKGREEHSIYNKTSLHQKINDTGEEQELEIGFEANRLKM